MDGRMPTRETDDEERNPGLPSPLRCETAAVVARNGGDPSSSSSNEGRDAGTAGRRRMRNDGGKNGCADERADVGRRSTLMPPLPSLLLLLVLLPLVLDGAAASPSTPVKISSGGLRRTSMMAASVTAAENSSRRGGSALDRGSHVLEARRTFPASPGWINNMSSQLKSLQNLSSSSAENKQAAAGMSQQDQMSLHLWQRLMQRVPGASAAAEQQRGQKEALNLLVISNSTLHGATDSNEVDEPVAMVLPSALMKELSETANAMPQYAFTQILASLLKPIFSNSSGSGQHGHSALYFEEALAQVVDGPGRKPFLRVINSTLRDEEVLDSVLSKTLGVDVPHLKESSKVGNSSEQGFSSDQLSPNGIQDDHVINIILINFVPESDAGSRGTPAALLPIGNHHHHPHHHGSLGPIPPPYPAQLPNGPIGPPNWQSGLDTFQDLFHKISDRAGVPNKIPSSTMRYNAVGTLRPPQPDVPHSDNGARQDHRKPIIASNQHLPVPSQLQDKIWTVTNLTRPNGDLPLTPPPKSQTDSGQSYGATAYSAHYYDAAGTHHQQYGTGYGSTPEGQQYDTPSSTPAWAVRPTPSSPGGHQHYHYQTSSTPHPVYSYAGGSGYYQSSDSAPEKNKPEASLSLVDRTPDGGTQQAAAQQTSADTAQQAQSEVFETSVITNAESTGVRVQLRPMGILSSLAVVLGGLGMGVLLFPALSATSLAAPFLRRRDDRAPSEPLLVPGGGQSTDYDSYDYDEPPVRGSQISRADSLTTKYLQSKDRNSQSNDNKSKSSSSNKSNKKTSSSQSSAQSQQKPSKQQSQQDNNDLYDYYYDYYDTSPSQSNRGSLASSTKATEKVSSPHVLRRLVENVKSAMDYLKRKDKSKDDYSSRNSRSGKRN